MNGLSKKNTSGDFPVAKRVKTETTVTATTASSTTTTTTSADDVVSTIAVINDPNNEVEGPNSSLMNAMNNYFILRGILPVAFFENRDDFLEKQGKLNNKSKKKSVDISKTTKVQIGTRKLKRNNVFN